MKLWLLIIIIFIPWYGFSETLCFSPVKEKKGDKSTDRGAFQSFDYKVQVNDGPIIVPSENSSTSYEYFGSNPLVKIWLGNKIFKSFEVKQEWLEEGRTCIYFKNLYETWSVVEKWQAKKLCSCQKINI